MIKTMEKIITYIFIGLLCAEAVFYILCILKTYKESLNVSYVIWLLNITITIILFFDFAKRTEIYENILRPAAVCIGGTSVVYGGWRIYKIYKTPQEKEDKIYINQIYSKKQFKRDYKKIAEYKNRLGYFRHDITKHISVLETISDNNSDSILRLEELKEKLNQMLEVKYCDNKFLDNAIEKKLLELSKKEIKVETDIRLNNITDIPWDIISLIIWLLIDNIAIRLERKDRIYIKLHEKEMKGGERYISYYIETDKNSIRIRTLERSWEMKLIKYLFERLDGSIVLVKKNGKVSETGYFLGGG